MATGYLVVNVYSDTIANPIENATIIVSKDGEEITTTTTNINGQTEPIVLETVDKSYSEQQQSEIKPYDTYDISVDALGLIGAEILNIQIFDGITSIQNVYLTSIDNGDNTTITSLPDNILWEEDSINQSDNRVLQSVIIPENIIVHNGIPSNTSAANYTVSFIDYIKNVASSEIYSTWPEEAIKANVFAIISFTLNRIYTEWYLSKGYSFTITSTSSYDQKYTVNGTIYSTISDIVDEIFDNYIKYGYNQEPLLAHYLSSTTEDGYLSQWGSKYLADEGYTALEILRYYYGDDINIYQAEVSTEYPYSFSETLKLEDCNINVYYLQNTLNYIRGSYPGIPIIENPTGFFDESTESAVKKFQNVFSLTKTGTVNYQTWYKISYIYTAVSNMTNSIYS